MVATEIRVNEVKSLTTVSKKRFCEWDREVTGRVFRGKEKGTTQFKFRFEPCPKIGPGSSRMTE